MKKVFSLIVFFVFFATGCTTHIVLYHSVADLPFYSSSCSTDWYVIRQGESKIDLDFGIVAAVDNDTLGYLIICPKKYNYKDPYAIDEYLLDFGITLSYKDTEKLLSYISDVIDYWNYKPEKYSGKFKDFMITREDLIKLTSPNITNWYPMLHIYFGNLGDDPYCTMFLGQFPMQYNYKLAYKELNAFKNDLQRGLAKMNRPKLDGTTLN